MTWIQSFNKQPLSMHELPDDRKLALKAYIVPCLAFISYIAIQDLMASVFFGLPFATLGLIAYNCEPILMMIVSVAVLIDFNLIGFRIWSSLEEPLCVVFTSVVSFYCLLLFSVALKLRWQISLCKFICLLLFIPVFFPDLYSENAAIHYILIAFNTLGLTLAAIASRYCKHLLPIFGLLGAIFNVLMLVLHFRSLNFISIYFYAGSVFVSAVFVLIK